MVIRQRTTYDQFLNYFQVLLFITSFIVCSPQLKILASSLTGVYLYTPYLISLTISQFILVFLVFLTFSLSGIH